MDMKQEYPSTFDGLLRLVAHLRSPAGCPWDREQTRESMRRYILEECYELLEALDEGATSKLAEELGDLLFHLAFQIQLGAEEGALTHEQVFRAAIEKLTRRHPHVFGDETVSDARQVESNWAAIKRAERTDEESSILDGVPREMPALSYAQAIQQKAAYTGFDWEDVQGVLQKVGEEVEELRSAQSPGDRERELGDLLFSIVNLGRWLGADAEAALREAGARFRRRYNHMEKLSRERGDTFEGLTLDEKEALWQKAKRTVG
jgi:tetrapyrrole methylase family protein/MazG family protein